MIRWKKVLVFTVSIIMFFSNFYNVSYIYSSYNEPNNIEESQQSNISSQQLISLLKGKWLTKSGLIYLLKIRNISIEDIKKALRWNKKQKITLVKRIIWNWLNKENIDYLEQHWWLKYKGKSLIKKFTMSNNNISSSNFNTNKGIFSKKNFIKMIDNSKKIYKINFIDIKPGISAGKVQASFIGKENLPKKLILEQWFSYNINPVSLEKNLVKSNKLKLEIETLEKNWINIGKFSISKPKLDILPDRIRYSKNIKISFTKKSEFNNIKKHLSSYLNPQKIQQTNGKLDNKYVKIDGKASTIKSSDFNKDLILACQEKAKDKGISNTKCSSLDYNQLEKSIIIEDSIDISLIPLTIDDIKKWKISINMPPKDINMTRTEILQKFDLLKQIRLIKNNPLLNAEMDWPIPKHDMNKKDYCDIYYNADLQQAKADGDTSKVEEKIKQCKLTQTEVNKITTSKYAQKLLNGFTLGEQKSYNWSTKISVDTYLFGEIDIFEFDFSFYYLYAVWIRIPMEIKWTIQDSMVHDYALEWEDSETDFKTEVKINTLNGDSNFYKDVWIKDEHIYDGQELVLKFGSGIKFHVRTPITSHIRYEIKLASLLVDQIKDWLLKMGISEKEIQKFKDDNLIDLSKDFTPPFGGNNMLRLLQLESNPIVLLSIYGIDLLGKIGLKVDIDGRVTAKCETVNSNGGCPAGDGAKEVDIGTKGTSINIWYDSSRIHFDTENNYSGNGKAVYNGNEAINDDLWFYSKFGIKLNDFKYHPILLLTLYALVGVGIPDIPYIWDLVVWSPEIDIYTLKFSSDDLYLGTHSGTNGVFDMSSKNKIYSTSSTLKEISSIKVNKVWNNKLIAPRSEIYIEPLSNTHNGNSMFYRTDGVYPSCEVNSNTKVYTKWSQLWTNSYQELINEKSFDIKAIACDMFHPTDPRARKTYHKNVKVQAKNYYHKPLFINIIITKCLDPLNTNNKNYKEYFSYYNTRKDYYNFKQNELLQEEYNNLDFKMPLSNTVQESFIKISAHPENSNYFIKYTFTDKNSNNNNYQPKLDTLNFNITNINYTTNSTSDICNNNLRTKYNNEIFVAGKENSDISLIPDEFQSPDLLDKLVYYDKDKVLKAVKCIKKEDWTYFQSLITTANIKVENMLPNTCSSQSTPIDQEWWRIHLDEKMKKDIIDPIFDMQSQWGNIMNNWWILNNSWIQNKTFGS